MQAFDMNQTHLMNMGRSRRLTLIETIDLALNRNPDNDNFIIQSLPGLGKTYELDQAVALLNSATGVPYTVFRGSTTLHAFGQDLAVARAHKSGRHIIILDDCDSLFTDKNNINVLKEMFGNSRSFTYGKDVKRLFPGMSTLEQDAVKFFMDPTRKGFRIPVHEITFIILTNVHFPDVNEVESAVSMEKQTQLGHMYAIRRRCEYKSIDIDRMELWGYVADVVMNGQICERYLPTISEQTKVQMLSWAYTNWMRMTERNLSVIEKMTKKIKNFPNNYLDIWNDEYISKVALKGRSK